MGWRRERHVRWHQALSSACWLVRREWDDESQYAKSRFSLTVISRREELRNPSISDQSQHPQWYALDLKYVLDKSLVSRSLVTRVLNYRLSPWWLCNCGRMVTLHNAPCKTAKATGVRSEAALAVAAGILASEQPIPCFCKRSIFIMSREFVLSSPEANGI